MMTKVLLIDKWVADIQNNVYYVICKIVWKLQYVTQWTIIHIRPRLLTNAENFTRESGSVNPVRSDFISLVTIDLVL